MGKPTPYQRIMVAAKAGRGVLLSADEVHKMAGDHAIHQLAENDDDHAAGCICKGHVHEGGVGGCYIGGRLGLPPCPCRWRSD